MIRKQGNIQSNVMARKIGNSAGRLGHVLKIYVFVLRRIGLFHVNRTSLHSLYKLNVLLCIVESETLGLASLMMMKMIRVQTEIVPFCSYVRARYSAGQAFIREKSGVCLSHYLPLSQVRGSQTRKSLIFFRTCARGVLYYAYFLGEIRPSVFQLPNQRGQGQPDL